ncbi:class I SAM-dependent methyltransferase [Paenibacillus methanolicus]|uniref:class I SAM-dependent methyltransferase n=1 Tax=Paenibacillus methanolicus TaxID=582686 RepID=UPI0011E68A91|nr:class I SAM-dependent methyltransferase [Paenibacillus methanolicus]
MKDNITRAFNLLSSDYEKHVDKQSGHNAYYERPAMINLMPTDMRQMNILDAGCAAGWYTEHFIHQGAQVSAIDISPDMTEACRRRIGNRATIIQGDLSETLPFSDRTFDLIVSSLTLHYLEDWASTFREFHRIMKPGAGLIFSVHHPFMDYTHFSRPDYFARELLTEVWNKPEAGAVEVSFYRRSMQDIVNATSECFVLESIVEPQPVRGDMNDLDYSRWHAKWFDKLATTPHFLIVKARKADE